MKILLTFLGLLAVAFGTTLEPTQDTYANIVSVNQQCNYRGSEPAMFAGRSGFGGIVSTAYVLFDLTGISSVSSATLNLTAGCAPQGDVDGIEGNGHALDRTDIGWTESTLSGTTLPGLSGCPSLPSVITADVASGTVINGILSVSVTSAVSSALSSGGVSFAVRFTDAGNNKGTNFCVRSSSSSLRPKLVIT